MVKIFVFGSNLAGIHGAGTSNVFDMVEFNSVNILNSHGLPSILRSTSIPKDFWSYSSYESMGSPAQMTTDLATIKGIIGGDNLIDNFQAWSLPKDVAVAVVVEKK